MSQPLYLLHALSLPNLAYHYCRRFSMNSPWTPEQLENELIRRNAELVRLRAEIERAKALFKLNDWDWPYDAPAETDAAVEGETARGEDE